MVCPRCQINQARIHSLFGVINCESCELSSVDEYDLPSSYQPEFVGTSIKQQRKSFKRDTIQKYRYGTLSKEWIDAYPNKAKQHHSKEELKAARKVWNNDI